MDSSFGPLTAAVGEALHGAFGSEHLPSRLTSVERADVIVAIGDDISASNNVLGVRIKDAVANNGASLVSISARVNPLAHYAVEDDHVLAPGDGDLAAVAQALAAGLLKDMDVRTSLSDVEGLAEVSAAAELDVSAAAETLRQRRGGAAAVIVAPSRANAAQAAAQVRAAANLAIALAGAEDAPAALHVLPPEANSVGLRDIGITPAEARFAELPEDAEEGAEPEQIAAAGIGVTEMIAAAQRGELKALVVARDNPMLLHPDSEATRRALAALELLVVIDEVETETAALATHLLPDVSAFAKDGHVTNADRQVLRLRAGAEPQRNARTAEAWLRALAAQLDLALPDDAWSALAESDARYAGLPSYLTASRQPVNGASTQRMLAVEPAASDGSGLTLLAGRDLYTDRLSAARGAEDADQLHRADSVQLNPADAADLGIETGASTMFTQTSFITSSSGRAQIPFELISISHPLKPAAARPAGSRFLGRARPYSSSSPSGSPLNSTTMPTPPSALISVIGRSPVPSADPFPFSAGGSEKSRPVNRPRSVTASTSRNRRSEIDAAPGRRTIVISRRGSAESSISISSTSARTGSARTGSPPSKIQMSHARPYAVRRSSAIIRRASRSACASSSRSKSAACQSG